MSNATGHLNKRPAASSKRSATLAPVDENAVGSHLTPKEPPEPRHWAASFAHRHALIVENSGSVARDHLANERTYLAWTRTALVMMTLGLAFMQLYSIQIRAHEAVYEGTAYALRTSHGVDALRTAGKPFGILIGVFSLVTMGFGFFRYMLVQSGLRHGEFPATRFIASAVLLMCAVSMALILVIDIKSL